MALDACSDHAAEKMTLLDRPGRRPTVPISPISPGLAQDPIPQQKSEITPVPPSPTPPSDASDSHVEDTIVCAPVGVPSSDGLWYILHCDEHQKAFQHPALRGAAAHLKGSKHGLPWYPTSLEVIKHFGVEVIDCDAELADKNNTVALAVSQASKKASECKAEEKTSPKKRLHESNDESEVKEKEVSKRQSKQRRISGITRPTPGRIYLAYWETTKDWFPALVLPHIGLEAFGIPSTLEKLGLMNSTPDCLRCESDTQNLKWREGYEHDGPYAMDREFPILFFDRRDFPEQASAGWVKASDLQELSVFKSSSRLVPNLKFAKKYLRKRLQQETEFSDEDSWASSEESDSETPPLCTAGNESQPEQAFTSVRLEPEQPAADAPTNTAVEDKVPLSANNEPESGNAASVPLTPGESRPGTSSNPQVEAAPTNTITHSIRDDITIISISSSDDEMENQDQPAKSSQPPTADNRMAVDPRHSVVTEMKDVRPNTSISSGQSFDLKPTILLNGPITGYTTQGVAPAPPLRNGQQPQVQLPTPVHVHHIQHTLPNNATIDLRNLMTRSTYMAFPGALPGSEAPQSQLPPYQPPTNRRPLQVPPQVPYPQGPVTTGFHHHRLPPSQDQQAHSNPAISPSRPEISHVSPRPPIPAETRAPATRPPAARPLQPKATSAPPPPPPPPPRQPESRPQVPKVPIPPAPKPNSYQAPVPTGNPTPPPSKPYLSTPTPWQPVYIGKALQLETTNPRFGVPPNEVPPPFLDRLKKLAGTRDNFPKMAKFLDGEGFYFCPWCEKRYRRPVKFTDHLVLNHSR
ncbi:uncharacterized protein NECHADRAFT_102169 [Fusarium vanettenii 77-13-4]|uniref:C2H2-type domain-containing protein n=1 Tax=Fusarium vanettenii (strain ATCC MYA-4622 / CBS 123669 / FGSC 9596 / NRRL 45880 / 77-13-4) TaxID=660122 RepID=C7Z336_FUSV7|nr:uncharacterized protein NECHADRAFT_102169 [Fusarium vanettenii 77-13-4]EEU41763.1 predicted protein [Fusarium vanettenii 77-13-4]